LVILDLLKLTMSFRVEFSISARNAIRILVEITLTLYIPLGRISTITLGLPAHECGIAFYLVRSLHFFQQWLLAFSVPHSFSIVVIWKLLM
jgi:hypothetical protein